MTSKNSTYVCFDGDTDIHYYRLMSAWHENKNFEFHFKNAHDINTARDSSQEESIKRQLRIRLMDSNLFIVLIGEKTKYLTKFVKWEMEVALRLDLPIIGVNLNKSLKIDDRCPSTIRDELAIYVPFGANSIKHAMGNWPRTHVELRGSNRTGPYRYPESVYNQLDR